jgi:hypothetical protein
MIVLVYRYNIILSLDKTVILLDPLFKKLVSLEWGSLLKFLLEGHTEPVPVPIKPDHEFEKWTRCAIIRLTDYNLEFSDHIDLAPLSNVELSVYKFKGKQAPLLTQKFLVFLK